MIRGEPAGAAQATDHIVGISEMIVVKARAGRITTHALGSCIGLSIWDPTIGVGGILHFMLPQPTSDEQAKSRPPAMFASLGVPALFRRAYELGATKEALVVSAAGAATMLGDDSGFQIGRRNRTIMRKLFWKNNIVLASEQTGGTDARTMSLDLASGTVVVRARGREEVLWKP